MTVSSSAQHLFRLVRLGLLALLLGFLSVLSSAVLAKAVLDYQLDNWQSAPSLPLPESAFHSWAESQQEAQQLVRAWQQKEALTIPWTRLQLARYIKHKIMPVRAARGLALTHVAMYDALQLSSTYQQSSQVVVSAAAARVLAYLFPAEESAFQRIAFAAAAQLEGVTPQQLSPQAKAALLLGDLIGQRVVARAETDGAQRGWNGVRLQWYGEGRYYGPGAWEPTPPYYYYPPDEPFAPTWQTWVLTSADQFRPTPPLFGSARYMRDLKEVLEIDRKRTPKQLAIANFWVDGHGSYTPPGHWNDIAIGLASKHKLDAQTTAHMFMSLNVALADSFIACWEAKYHYWTMRPLTAAKYLLGKQLVPPILTPPFPSYVSGHATFSGAAAKILAHYMPTEANHLNRMAQEAAHSRLLGAIHFRFDNEDGLVLGQKVADFVLDKLH